VASSDRKIQVRRDDGKTVSLEILRLTEIDRQWIDRKVEEIQAINTSLKNDVVFVRAAPTQMAEPPRIEETFEPFAKLKAIEYRKDNRFFYVESNGMPDHRMMVCFHGEVNERGGQVDPQPRAEGLRPAQSPLRDATITDFEAQKDGNYHLEFRVGNETRKIDYQILENGTVNFRYTDGRGRVTTESYKPRRR
jgi:hypothetical protein